MKQNTIFFVNSQKILFVSIMARLTDTEILTGFREGDEHVFRDYFYPYCRQGYHVFDKKYQLQGKENLDMMSLAHQYALYLIEHHWKPLENRSSNISLCSWFIGGFKYIVLDALKWYQKEYGSITYEDYLMSFDMTSDLRTQFNRMVEDLCLNAHLDRQERLMIDMILLRGFKAKDLAAQMGLTPSAVSQRYKKLKEQLIIPYFREHFDMDLDMTEVMDERTMVYKEIMAEREYMPSACRYSNINLAKAMEEKRTTPEFITELQPGEIFVFGSNLKGMHGGGAAYIAYRKFGAVIGQGVGLQGQSYAIPTMQGGVETIRPYVDDFIQFAKEHPELTFLVTRIGCGIAGFDDDDISPLFEDAHEVDNIVLPPGW